MQEPQWNDVEDLNVAHSAQRSAFAVGSAAFFVLACGAIFLFAHHQPTSSAPQQDTPNIAAPVVSTPPAPVFTSMAWENSFDNTLQRARNENKLVMINFYTDWCGACKYVDTYTYTSPSVITESQNFVNLKVNAEQQTDLATRYGVRQYPTFVFTDAAGNALYQNAKAYGPQDFVPLLQELRSRYASKPAT